MPKKQLTEVPVVPSKVAFWSTTVGKTLRAALYLGLSAALAGVVASIQDNPAMFGVYTPIINLALVAVKNGLDPDVRNI